MKIENYIVFCLVIFYAFKNEQIMTLRISNLKPNNNSHEKNSINFSWKNEAINANNNINKNSNLNLPLIGEKAEPPTFSRAFIDQPKLGNAYILLLYLVIH